MSFAPYAYSFSTPGLSPLQLSIFAPSFRSLSSPSSPSSSSSTTSVVHHHQTTTPGLLRPSPPPPLPLPPPLPPPAPRPRVATVPSSAVASPSTMFGPNLLHVYPRIGGAVHESMRPPPAAAGPAGAAFPGSGAGQGFSPFAPNASSTSSSSSSAFYAPLNGESVDAWRTISGHLTSPNGWSSFDPSTIVGYPYSATYGGLDVRRKNATRESTSTLKAWLYEHIKNPYPTKGEKIMLAIITKMTLTQVSTWFANARRRLKKENKMQWSPRNRAGDDDDEDDDNDKNSDNDEDAGSRSGLTQNDDNDEDEDIVVDSGNDDSFPLSPPHCFSGIEFLGESGLKENCTELEKTPRKISPALSDTEQKDDFISRDTTPGEGHEGSGRPGYSVTCSSSLTSSASTAVSALSVTTTTVGTATTTRPSDKPRIWSLADVATSNTPPGGSRRTVPNAQSFSARPHLAPIITSATCHSSTSRSSGHRSFQPWMYISSSLSPSSSSSSSPGNSPLTGYGNSPLIREATSAGLHLDVSAASCGASAVGVVGTGVRDMGSGSQRSLTPPEQTMDSESRPLQRLGNGAPSERRSCIEEVFDGLSQSPQPLNDDALKPSRRQSILSVTGSAATTD